MSAKNGKKKWIIIVVAVILVASIIGVAIWANSQQEETTVSGNVELISKRTIANSITGNGVVEAASSEDITGGSYGMKVATVNVAEGDVVSAGDIICVFDTKDIDEQIKTLEERVVETETERVTQNWEYNQDILDANANRQEQLTTAMNNLTQAQEDLAAAEAELAQKQAEYDAYIADEDPTHTSTTLEAIQMESVIETKEANVESMKMRVDNYQSQIDSLNEQDNSNIEETKKNYNDRVDSSVESINDQLELLYQQKEDAVIKTSISGVVTSVNVTEGATFAAGVIATVECTDKFIVEAQIEEYDIPDVSVGMKVLIKTDATREEELEGVVSYVAPRATNSGSSGGDLSSLMGGMDTSSLMSSGTSNATYLVKIELKEQNDRLRLGMNAKTSIITEEKNDIWAVPYDAVYTRDDGSTYLEQVTGKDEKGNPITKEMDVEIGIQGTYYVEVISSLINEATEILIPDAQGNSSIEELLNMMGADAGI